MDIAQALYDKYSKIYNRMKSNEYYRFNDPTLKYDRILSYGKSIHHARFSVSTYIVVIFNLLYASISFTISGAQNVITVLCQMFILGAYLYLLWKEHQCNKIREQFDQL